MLEVRTIDVKPGDAFYAGISGVWVVETEDGLKAFGRDAKTGKRSAIQITRLQEEYRRLGTKATKAAHRKLAQMDKQKLAAGARR